MTTSVVEVGVDPLHQLEGVDQSLVIPSQVLLGTQGWAVAQYMHAIAADISNNFFFIIVYWKSWS